MVCLGRLLPAGCAAGRVLSARGEHSRAIEMMQEALDAYRAIGQRIALPIMMAALAESHTAAGERRSTRCRVAVSCDLDIDSRSAATDEA